MDINNQADALAAFLKANLGATVTRDVSFFNRRGSELKGKPVYTLIIGSGRAEGIGSMSRAPVEQMVLLLLVQQNLTGKSVTGADVEKLELNFRSKIRNALISPDLPPALSGIVIKNWVTSGQQNLERAEILMNLSVREY
jgi:hypothetical protein